MRRYRHVPILLSVLVCLSLEASLSVRADPRKALSPFLVRAQATRWPLPTGNPPLRIERNDAGNIVKLRLEGMQLEPDDVEVIRSFRQLETLGLSYTSINDRELATLADLTELKGIALNYTDIGDGGVAALAKFPKLKSVCLFRIPASPDAVRGLRAERRNLSIGYSQR